MHLHLFAFNLAHTLAMATRPTQMSRVRALVDELVALVGSEWATTIDQPFITTGYTERTVIFDLRFRMEAGDDEPIVMWKGIIERHL